MNKFLIATAIAAASFVSTNANAQAYVSGHVGMGNISVDCFGDCDKSNVAFKVLGGYGFGNGFAAELGYASFGEVKGGGDKLTVNGLLIGAAYHAVLNPSWGLTGRLGLARLKTKLSSGGFSDSETNTAPYFGISGTYALQKNVKLEAGLDFSRGEYDGDKGDVRALTVGARFEF